MRRYLLFSSDNLVDSKRPQNSCHLGFPVRVVKLVKLLEVAIGGLVELVSRAYVW
jgi:hypothetical protein